MSQIPSSARALKASASALRSNADTLRSCNGALLLRFYSVECDMKERYIRLQLASPHGDTSLIPAGTFGGSGHDLDAGRKALRAPATLPAAPSLKLRANDAPVTIKDAHQVWRYNIAHEGADLVEAWLQQVATWLKETA